MKNLNQITGQYSYGFLTDTFMFLHELLENQITPEQFLGWMERDRATRQEAAIAIREVGRKWEKIYLKRAPDCPVCGQRLLIEEINNHPRRMVDDHSHSWWVCQNPICEYDPKLDDRFPHEIMDDLGIPPVPGFHPPIRSTRRMRAASQQRSGCSKKNRRQ